jgi:uncharacterized membrane protein YccC
MKLEHRALLQTTGIIVGVLASALLIAFVLGNITLEIGMWILGIAFFAFWFRITYSEVLWRLRITRGLDDHNKSA